MTQEHSPRKNWAGNYAYRAEKLHRPSTIEQVQEIVANAPSVRVLGSRHSFNDIADSSELITLEAMPTEVVVDHAAQYIHATLHKALDQAVKWRLIPYNVSDAVAKPRQKRSERDALTLRQVLNFFEVAKGDRFEALYMLAVFTGMRPGEVLALRWSDLVLDDPEPAARVRRSISKDDNGRLVIKSTKTEKGRAIALLPQVVEALQTHRKQQAEQRLRYSGLWRDEDLIFSSKTGGPMSWNNLVKRNLKPLMSAAGLPQGTRPYDLRHTFATLILEQGENPKVVQEVLGHSRITHTMDTYSHVSPNIQREAFGRLGKRLKGP